MVANWLIFRVSGIALHDYGCTLKAYRREVIEGVRLYGEMHRFIPVYAAWQGRRSPRSRSTTAPAASAPRSTGSTGSSRSSSTSILVRFLFQYLAKPIYVFGGFELTRGVRLLPRRGDRRRSQARPHPRLRGHPLAASGRAAVSERLSLGPHGPPRRAHHPDLLREPGQAALHRGRDPANAPLAEHAEHAENTAPERLRRVE